MTIKRAKSLLLLGVTAATLGLTSCAGGSDLPKQQMTGDGKSSTTMELISDWERFKDPSNDSSMFVRTFKINGDSCIIETVKGATTSTNSRTTAAITCPDATN